MVRAALPSSTGRHALRQNQAKHNGGDHARSDDEFVDHNESRARSDSGDLRASFAASRSHASDCDDEKDPIPASRRPSQLPRSQSLSEALSDSNSTLARFLLNNSAGDSDDEGNGAFDGLFGNNATMKSVRNIATRFITGEDEVQHVGSLRSSKAWFYSLALEPMDVRRDRVVMLAEAYAIFGALFLGGTWVLYEWGSGYGYGGCRYSETSFCHPAVDRAFEVVMALAITANLFQAMFSSFLWLMSILFGASHRNWVYGARNLLLLCHILLCCILVFTVAGVGLGIYAKLAPYWPETAIALAFLVTTVFYGMWATSHLAAEEIALEYYHFPLWFKWGLLPFPMLRKGGRQRIREAAEVRAQELMERANQERTILNPKSRREIHRAPRTSAGALLRKCADAIHRYDFDVSKYEEKLEDDWYRDADELKHMSVDALSKYMPRRLAEEVHNQLAEQAPNEGVVRTTHIASGKSDREGRVSWKLDEDSDFEEFLGVMQK